MYSKCICGFFCANTLINSGVKKRKIPKADAIRNIPLFCIVKLRIFATISSYSFNIFLAELYKISPYAVIFTPLLERINNSASTSFSIF